MSYRVLADQIEEVDPATTTTEQERQAIRTVCAHSKTREEAEESFLMLGLDPRTAFALVEIS